jgi:hypothetical protein
VEEDQSNRVRTMRWPASANKICQSQKFRHTKSGVSAQGRINCDPSHVPILHEVVRSKGEFRWKFARSHASSTMTEHGTHSEPKETMTLQRIFSNRPQRLSEALNGARTAHQRWFSRHGRLQWPRGPHQRPPERDKHTQQQENRSGPKEILFVCQKNAERGPFQSPLSKLWTPMLCIIRKETRASLTSCL